MKNYYLCNKVTKEVIQVGRLPEVYGGITGMADLDDSSLQDLSWAGEQYKDIGFLTEESALSIGIPLSCITMCKNSAMDLEWNRVRAERDMLITQVRWRIDRYNDEVALGMTPTENVMPLLVYIQKLRDVTLTQYDPFSIVWPIEN